MGNSKQALTYQRPSSIRDYKSWTRLGYVAAALLALVVVVAVSQGPGVPDPSFASAAVLP
jgi:hypothetical protein